MQPQDATTLYFFKIWPWIEKNKNRIIAVVAIIIAAIFLIYFFSWQRAQTEINAGKSLTQVFISTPPDAGAAAQSDLYLGVAEKNPGTAAGRRALLQAATDLFEAGRYADAQAQFQKFLDANPDNSYAAQAALGVASCLDAQNKTDLAADAYKRVINSYADETALNTAKFSLARIDEAQGKIADAFHYYVDVAQHSNPNGSLGSQAAEHAVELKSKLPSTPAAAAPAAPSAPFKLNQ